MEINLILIIFCSAAWTKNFDIDIIFEDNNSDGNFVPVNPFIPIENVDYELNVFYNEDLYQSQKHVFLLFDQAH